MKRISATLPDQLYHDLKQAAQEPGVSMAEVTRQALRGHLDLDKLWA
ncbi:MAG: ribbon-helix-helix protein, CopG family [Candidatus Eremiobacteraeota bacterium]|nr:ribbon-helix-helix protein, CopG family [Candidatus Eremiobacteraeota bacterium]